MNTVTMCWLKAAVFKSDSLRVRVLLEGLASREASLWDEFGL